jgi:hypothetical protein
MASAALMENNCVRMKSLARIQCRQLMEVGLWDVLSLSGDGVPSLRTKYYSASASASLPLPVRRTYFFFPPSYPSRGNEASGVLFNGIERANSPFPNPVCTPGPRTS